MKQRYIFHLGLALLVAGVCVAAFGGTSYVRADVVDASASTMKDLLVLGGSLAAAGVALLAIFVGI